RVLPLLRPGWLRRLQTADAVVHPVDLRRALDADHGPAAHADADPLPVRMVGAPERAGQVLRWRVIVDHPAERSFAREPFPLRAARGSSSRTRVSDSL